MVCKHSSRSLQSLGKVSRAAARPTDGGSSIAIDAGLRNLYSRLDKEEPYKIQGYPGRKIYFSVMKGDKDAYGQAIFFVVKNRFYVVMANNLTRDALTKPEIQSFFSSFKLTDEPER